jgi:tRNA(Ile)-lysidine synthase
MKIELPVGKYIVAVSGGVDSMVLLNMLSNLPNIELIVAHFNHGIRPEATEDEKLVRNIAKRLGLKFEVGYGRLGKNASEETARKARYKFLNEIKKKHKAKSIITAHHQDDLIETAILNLLRGTGRRGLVAMSMNEKILRPLLNYPKADILKYAKDHKLQWREDKTNTDETYLRNYVRRKLMPNLSVGQRKEVLKNIKKTLELEKILNPQIAELSQKIYKNSQIDRGSFSNMPFDLGNELVVFWLRQHGASNFDKKTVNRLNVALRTSKADRLYPVKNHLKIKIGRQTAQFINTL